MQYETVGVFLEKFIIVSIGIIILVLRLDILVFISVFLLAAVVKLVLSLWILKNISFPAFLVSSPPVCCPVKTAFPFGISVFLAMCYNYIGIILLSIMTGNTEVGVYSLSYRLLNFTTLIPVVLTTAFLPQLSLYHQDRRHLSELFLKGCHYVLIFAVPMIPFVILQAKTIVVVMGGSGWEDAELPLQLLVLAAFAQMFNNFLCRCTLLSTSKKRSSISSSSVWGSTWCSIFPDPDVLL